MREKQFHKHRTRFIYPSHPSHNVFLILSSSRRYSSLYTKNHTDSSFSPYAVMLMNSGPMTGLSAKSFFKSILFLFYIHLYNVFFIVYKYSITITIVLFPFKRHSVVVFSAVHFHFMYNVFILFVYCLGSGPNMLVFRIYPVMCFSV